MEEYYDILGLKPGASERDIEEAHKVAARVWHPDRFPEDPKMQEKANEELKKINLAREKLLEFLKRSPDEIGPAETGAQPVEQAQQEPPREPAAPVDAEFQAKPKRKSGLGKHLKWAVPVLAVLVAAVAFGYMNFFAWNPERQKLASINDRKITVAQFERELEKIPPPYQEVLREEPKQFLDQLVLKEVLLQEARRQNVKPDPSAKGEDVDLSMVQNLIQKEVLDKIQVDPKEVQDLYQQHKEQMGKKPLSEVAPMIEAAIREVKGKEKTEEYVVSVKNKAQVEINESRLKGIAAAPPPTNTKDEFAQALKSGQPMVVDFGANSCMPCRQIRPILQEIQKEYNGKARILIMDVYKYQDLARD
ncbi:MAG TPA: thioredoxin domain-containing protein, partial [Thermodesulfobacteriota bacterium]|nr:thioredoxin domain-containing protein [Thermodesulfobacteriota bacterium]